MKPFLPLAFLLAMTIQCTTGAEKQILFGEFVKGKNGGDEIRETTVMTLRKDLLYGWIARAPEGAQKIKYKEILRIPRSGYNFDGQKTESPKVVFETEKEEPVVHGKFGHKWRPSVTDPGGKYEITIEVNGKVIFTSEFSLLPP